MTAVSVDVIVAIHDLSRPIARTVRSVLASRSSERVRVIVVCHEISAASVGEALAGIDVRNIRLVEFSDGVRSAAGPFNHGLDEASSEYVCFIGSDDFLEPGAIDGWLDYVEAERPVAALARLRHQNGSLLHNPLARPHRVRELDVVKDRLFYRTAPLGFLHRKTIIELKLRFREGLRTGDDLDFGVRLLSSGKRIDFLRAYPSYVIGNDARSRVTTSPMSIEQSFEAINLLVEEPFVKNLCAEARRSLAIKLIRIHILGTLAQRTETSSWRDEGEVAHARATLRRVLSMATRVLVDFSRSDRSVLGTLLHEKTRIADVIASLDHANRAGLVSRNITVNPFRMFGRESVLRRYLVYALSR